MSMGWLPIEIFRFHPAGNIVGRIPQLHTTSPTQHQIHRIPYNKPNDTPSNTSHPFGLLDICCKSSAVCSEQIKNSLPANVCRPTLDLQGVVKEMMNTLKKPHSQPHLPRAPPCKLIPCPNTLCCDLHSQHKYFHLRLLVPFLLTHDPRCPQHLIPHGPHALIAVEPTCNQSHQRHLGKDKIFWETSNATC